MWKETRGDKGEEGTLFTKSLLLKIRGGRGSVPITDPVFQKEQKNKALNRYVIRSIINNSLTTVE